MIDALLDDVLELRRGFGLGIVTSLARLDGKPLGVIANDPTHLGGAIDAHGADKAARFMQLCDAFDLPVLQLADTPGFMVGPAAERTATVRHFSRMFVTGANLQVPTGTVILRKGYGLGAQAMAGGGFKAPLFTIGWPTSEFGAMGLEGAVKLGMRRELEAIEDPQQREQAFDAAVQAAYDRGKGISMAEYFEIDDVIDPPTPAAGSGCCSTSTRASGGGGPASAAPTSTRGDQSQRPQDTGARLAGRTGVVAQPAAGTPGCGQKNCPQATRRTSSPPTVRLEGF